MGIFGEWANEIRTWKIVPQQRLSKVKHFTKGNLGFSGTQTEPNMSGVHTKVCNFARSSIDNSMGLKHGTWKRLGPPNHATDATKASGWNTRWYFHWQEAMTTGWRNKSLRQAHGRQFEYGGGCYATPSGAMSILSWNCRGLRNLWFNALERAMNKKSITCVFLIETKLVTEQLNNMKQNWDYNQGLVLSSDGHSGGLALLWKAKAHVHIQNFSRWFIDTYIVCTNTGLKWRLIGFYGHPDTSKQEETWTLLESLQQSPMAVLRWLKWNN